MQSVAQLEAHLSARLPDLSPAPRKGLAYGVVGTVRAGSACRNAVCSLRATDVAAHGRLRPRLRRWLRDKPSSQGGYCGPAVDVRSCFVPLRRWILSLGQGSAWVLALDPTSHRDRVVSLAVRVAGALWARSCALPVAWQGVPAQQPSGSWVQAYCDLLPRRAPAIPGSRHVTVLCDRGIASPRLWDAICPQGWHPYLRYPQHIPFQSREPCGRGPRRPARAWVTQPGPSCGAAGTALGPGRRRRCTRVAVGGAQRAAPWILLTDPPPAAVSREVYGVRVWMEQGFRIRKREGWHGHRTRRRDPGALWARVDRHWRVMAVATLQVLAYAGTLGVRVEDAALLGRPPWHLTPAPATLPARTRPRAVSVFRLGLTPLRRLCFQGRTWQGLWLRPESTSAPPLLSSTA